MSARGPNYNTPLITLRWTNRDPIAPVMLAAN
jgi:hypothetical protein